METGDFAELVCSNSLKSDLPGTAPYLLKQGRFAHFTDEDIAYFQRKIDEMWSRWLIPGVCAFDLAADIKKHLAKSEVEVQASA